MSNENKILYKDLSYKLQGLFFDIRNDLGSGHKESIYQKALEKELESAIRYPFRYHSWIIIFVAISSVVFVGIRGLKAEAAQFLLKAPPGTIVTGEPFRVSVLLNAEGDSINALEGTVLFPADRLELTGINDGDSIVPLWVERPEVPIGCTGTCMVKWSGVMPGGFSGTLTPSNPLPQPGQVLTLTFRAKVAGTFLLNLADVRAFRNDGEGTEIAAPGSSLSVAVGEGEREGAPPEAPDTTPPEPFTPQLLQTPALFDGAWALAWSTQDKQSGIAHYEVSESRTRLAAHFGRGERAESPYRLHDQSLKSYIFVRAVDQAGNEIVAELTPTYPLLWYEAWWIWSIIISIIIFSFVVIKRNLWHK
ncbi:MAG: GxxExxY protein [Candidatus Jorgensenbacteria bacterium]